MYCFAILPSLIKSAVVRQSSAPQLSHRTYLLLDCCTVPPRCRIAFSSRLAGGAGSGEEGAEIPAAAARAWREEELAGELTDAACAGRGEGELAETAAVVNVAAAMCSGDVLTQLLHFCTMVPLYCCTGSCCRGSNLILFSSWPGGGAAAVSWRGGGETVDISSAAAATGAALAAVAAVAAVAAIATVDAAICNGEVTAPPVVTWW